MFRKKASFLWQALNEPRRPAALNSSVLVLKAGIESGIHAMQALWALHEREENWAVGGPT
jgi:hypothetical protein